MSSIDTKQVGGEGDRRNDEGARGRETDKGRSGNGDVIENGDKKKGLWNLFSAEYEI